MTLATQAPPANAQATPSTEHLDLEQVRQLADAAGRKIAPLWPLDSFVAVNPYLGLIDQSFSKASGYLAAIAGERTAMDHEWYAARWADGRLTREHIERAVEQLGNPVAVETVINALESHRTTSTPVPMLVEALDRPGAAPISIFVVDQISHFLAAHFDRGQAIWSTPDESESLYTAWREYTLIDRSARAAGLGQARRYLREVPTDPIEAIAWAIETLQLPESVHADYLFAALKSINGWAAYCRYRLWGAELTGGTCDDLTDLLAVRLVWEALALKSTDSAAIRREWQRQIERHHEAIAAAQNEAIIDEVMLTATEIAFRDPVVQHFREATAIRSTTAARPPIQAAFCIDVRSEVFRRHLETSFPGAQTIGFAGFFGVPLAYRRLGESQCRTHTPVLLNPGVTVEDHVEDNPDLAARRQQRIGNTLSWKQFKLSAASCFTFVESAGLTYLPKLIGDTLGWHTPTPPPDEAGLTDAERAQVHPALGTEASVDERVGMAEGILRGLGLTDAIAPIVLVAGHGSTTTNNPHRAGLDCGACAGQTGEVSARVAADLLNDPVIRPGLAERGIEIPADTRFIAALHDTTTDEVGLLDLEEGTVEQAKLDELRQALGQAGDLTRLERLVTLRENLSDNPADREAARKSVTHRGRDWSEVRPEWGLAGNAAFIAAPRERTRDLDLGGRSFLHDYDWRKDEGFGVLELILTAPLVVASWINLQYYGSTVDNERQGSGNKVLHNVVGGLVGVLEGNGGDLRVGLSMQSLHDGENWRHEPLRLSAFVEAPAEAIDTIIAGNQTLQHLIDNRWLTLLRLDDAGEVFRRRGHGDWVAETT
ncbi:YbcC family protein [Guyparkeria halopsychrophila]|uniref:YbcC family protein n=1 Tax=Guyparkeria halopsychrophila TaxID=3139421 RepID=UPI0037CB532F